MDHFNPTHIFLPGAPSSGIPLDPPNTPNMEPHKSPIELAMLSELTIIDSYEDELEMLLLPPPPKLQYSGVQRNGYPRQIWFIKWVDEYEKITAQNRGYTRKLHTDFNPAAFKKRRITDC